MHKIQIIGAITDESFAEFSKALDAIRPGSKVEIELFSFGGEALSGLAFASKIRQSSCRITVTAYGQVASAAVIILAFGHKRRMSKEAWVMVHEDTGKLKFDSVHALERESGHMRRLEDQWASLLEGATNTSADKWAALHKKTTYLNAFECEQLGLVDEVI